jgi:hypothetical protein
MTTGYKDYTIEVAACQHTPENWSIKVEIKGKTQLRLLETVALMMKSGYKTENAGETAALDWAKKEIDGRV